MRSTHRSLTLILIVLFALAFLTSCDIFEPEEPKEAKFVITSTTKGMKSYGRPYVTITVKNTGNATGYNVSCDVKAKKGNLIVDTGFAYFANGADIHPGESAVDEAIFFDLSSHNDYDKLEYDLDWLKR